MWQNFGRRNCRNFAAFEGSPHENGYNSETKSRKMLPKVPKQPERRGLGPYSKKTKFLGQIFFWPFLAFFGHFLTVFGPVGIEKTIFVKSVFSKHCFYWSKRKKNPQPKSQFPQKNFLKRSNEHLWERCIKNEKKTSMMVFALRTHILKKPSFSFFPSDRRKFSIKNYC